MSRLETVSVISISLSARVDFPWSICAMMQKLRISSLGYAMYPPKAGRKDIAPHIILR